MTILNFVDHIISNIGNIIMCIIKYYTHSTYFDEKPTKKKRDHHTIQQKLIEFIKVQNQSGTK